MVKASDELVDVLIGEPAGGWATRCHLTLAISAGDSAKETTGRSSCRYSSSRWPEGFGRRKPDGFAGVTFLPFAGRSAVNIEQDHVWIRHSNLLERTFGETRRRVKVIGLPAEHSCLSLVWAVLDRASVGWRGIETSVAGIRLLQDLRRQLLGPPELRATGSSRGPPPDHATRMGQTDGSPADVLGYSPTLVAGLYEPLNGSVLRLGSRRRPIRPIDACVTIPAR